MIKIDDNVIKQEYGICNHISYPQKYPQPVWQRVLVILCFLPLAFPPVSGVHEIGVRTPYDVDNDH